MSCLGELRSHINSTLDRPRVPKGGTLISERDEIGDGAFFFFGDSDLVIFFVYLRFFSPLLRAAVSVCSGKGKEDGRDRRWGRLLDYRACGLEDGQSYDKAENENWNNCFPGKVSANI